MNTRKGFTLIELLLVVAIIAVLIGLLVPTISKAIATAKRASNYHDMYQLKMALENFKNQAGSYPPSYFRVYNQYPDGRYLYDQTDVDSQHFASKVFGFNSYTGFSFPDPNNPYSPPDGYCQPVPNQTNPPPPLPYWNLQGDQCLVFFLGGQSDLTNAGALNYIPSLLGFQTSRLKTNGFYEFKQSKLVWRKKNGFFSYLDVYGDSDNHGNIPNSDTSQSSFKKDHSKPWVYFSVRGGTYNNYQQSDSIDFPTAAGSFVTVYPYLLTGSKYHSPQSYQLLSAGPDRQWGGAMSWYVDSTYPNISEGFDDVASIHDRPLGVN